MTRRKIIALNDKALTRDRLLWATGVVLARDGFNSLTDTAICVEAGVPRKQLYLHFRGIRGILVHFRRRPEFWPTTQELVGNDMSALRAMAPAKLMAEFFNRFAAALRSRPKTLDILAWEMQQRNDYVRLLEIGRERPALEFFELMQQDPPDNVDLSALVAILASAVTYLAVRSRKARFYSGIDLTSADGWGRIDAGMSQILESLLGG